MIIDVGKQFAEGVLSISLKLGYGDHLNNHFCYGIQNNNKFYYKCLKFQKVELEQSEHQSLKTRINQISSYLTDQIEKSQTAISNYILKYQSIIVAYPYIFFVHKPIRNVLSAVINKKQLNYIQKLNLLLQITKGLKDLHEKYNCIGNLNLSNILIVNQNNNQFQIRFCALKIKHLQLLKNNSSNNIYIAPQAKDLQKQKPSCDIWSLGLIFYQVLFDQILETKGQSFQKPNVPEWAPSWVSQFFSKMMCNNPKDRYPIKDIQRILENALKCGQSTNKYFWCKK